MTARIVLDVYSGRPNPEWSLRHDEEVELDHRLAVLAPGSPAAIPAPPGLGYRGLIVRRLGRPELRVFHRSVIGTERRLIDPNRSLELWLLETGRTALDPEFWHDLIAEITRH